jgi:hypothetical protein
MKNTKDLNWLSAPAFFMIVILIVSQVKKNMNNTDHPEKFNKTTLVITKSK